MKSVNIYTKKDIEEAINKRFDIELKEINKQMDKLRNKMLDLEALFKYLR